MLPLVDPMHLKVTVCVMTVSPVVNSEREAVISVVLSSSLFSESEMVGCFRYHSYGCPIIFITADIFLPLPMPYYKNSTTILFSTSFTYNYLKNRKYIATSTLKFQPLTSTMQAFSEPFFTNTSAG